MKARTEETQMSCVGKTVWREGDPFLEYLRESILCEGGGASPSGVLIRKDGREGVFGVTG